MAPHQKMGNRTDFLELDHRVAYEGRALAVGTREALECATSNIVDIAIVEPGIVADVRRRLSVDPQEYKIAGDVGPGTGNCIHIALTVHFRSMKDKNRGP